MATGDNKQMKGSPLYSAQQVRDLDARAIAAISPSAGHVLMQRAALAAWQLLQKHWPQAKRIAVLVGPGNNGGDALELARLAHRAQAQGYALKVWLLADPQRYQAEAAQAWQGFRADGLALCEAPMDFSDCDVIVDGLLGSGLNRAVEAPFDAVIERANRSGLPILSLDLPSGICADTGAVLGAAIRADLSLSFVGRKQGLYSGDALDYVGQLHFDSLQIAPEIYAAMPAQAHLMPNIALASLLPLRQNNTHKGSNGHVLAIGGAPPYSGAIRLCSGAALRAGAGLVSVLTHPQSAALVAASQAELMVSACDQNAAEDVSSLQEFLRKADVVVIGPGLGGQGGYAHAWSRAMLDQALKFGGPKVFDADALNLLDLKGPWPADLVITPHPGEAGRLLGLSSRQVQADRYGAARRLASVTGSIVVLKGAGSIVARPDGDCVVCPVGNPGMAVAGMGDVLAGVIAAFAAQLANDPDRLWKAACAGVLAHAQAGDRVAARQGQRGLLPSDVIAELPAVLNS